MNKFIRALQFVSIALLANATYVVPVSHAAPASASLSFSVSSSTYSVGDSVPVDILLDTGGQAVAGVTIVIDYTGLTYSSNTSTNSVFETEVSAPVVTAGGTTVTFERSTAGVGYTGTAGQVLHLIFTATTAGSGSLTFDQPDSHVQAASDNSDILQTIADPISLTIDSASATDTPTAVPATATPTAGASATATPTPAPGTSGATGTATATPKSGSATTLPATGADVSFPFAVGSILIVAISLIQLRKRNA